MELPATLPLPICALVPAAAAAFAGAAPGPRTACPAGLRASGGRARMPSAPPGPAG